VARVEALDLVGDEVLALADEAHRVLELDLELARHEAVAPADRVRELAPAEALQRWARQTKPVREVKKM
jgi:hypothetical protein